MTAELIPFKPREPSPAELARTIEAQRVMIAAQSELLSTANVELIKALHGQRWLQRALAFAAGLAAYVIGRMV